MASDVEGRGSCAGWTTGRCRQTFSVWRCTWPDVRSSPGPPQRRMV